MTRFLHGHAAHPDWRVALTLAAAQIEGQRREAGDAAEPTLGWVYCTDHCADDAEAILAALRQRWPGVDWVGATGVGHRGQRRRVLRRARAEPAAGGAARASAFRVFSGVAPLRGFAASTAQVHADPATPDLAELIEEMSARTATGYLFGGLASSRSRAVAHRRRGPLRRPLGRGLRPRTSRSFRA